MVAVGTYSVIPSDRLEAVPGAAEPESGEIAIFS